jgi:GH24 family phage-related lysozyme (muramidase)
MNTNNLITKFVLVPAFLLGIVLFWVVFIFNNENEIITDIENKPYNYFEICIYELIRREGIVLESYTCPAGKPTIGIGYQTTDISQMTLQESKEKLYEDFQSRYDVFLELLPEHSKHEILAVTLLSHNLGINAVLSSSQWERIKNKDSDVVEYWLKYNKYKCYKTNTYKESDNLSKARELEVLLWTNDTFRLSQEKEYLRNNALNQYLKLM